MAKEKKLHSEEKVVEEKETEKAIQTDTKETAREKELQDKKATDLENELSKSNDEKNILNEKFLRMAAEYDNFRKRAQKEKDSIYPDAVIDTVTKFLPILDNLERASSFENSDDAVKEGISMISKQFIEILDKIGITEIKALNETFNPELHNAVMHEENEEIDENIITEVFMKGYIMGDKVVRHSVVKVIN